MPAMPTAPAVPTSPLMPTAPATPAIPTLPDAPTISNLPDAPAVPTVPTPPALPATPDLAAAVSSLPPILEARNEAGAVIARVPWCNGTIHGTLDAGAPGLPGSTMTFVNGVAQGPMTLRDAEGRVTASASLVAGQLDGPMTLFDDAGRPVRRLHYEAGQLLREEPLTLAGRLADLWKAIAR
jgi:hypothetical protein